MQWNVNTFVCCVRTDASGLSRGIGSVEHTFWDCSTLLSQACRHAAQEYVYHPSHHGEIFLLYLNIHKHLGWCLSLPIWCTLTLWNQTCAPPDISSYRPAVGVRYPRSAQGTCVTIHWGHRPVPGPWALALPTSPFLPHNPPPPSAEPLPKWPAFYWCPG